MNPSLPPLIPTPTPASAAPGAGAAHPVLSPAAGPLPLGDDPRDCEPIAGAFGAVDAILRHPRRLMYWMRQGGAGGGVTIILALVAVACSLVYGVVVGSFSGATQLWAAPVKIAGGLFLSAIICLPSLFIFACLSGARARLADVCGLVAGLLALMTILLVGFAPVAWVFSQSTDSIPAMGALHLIFWAVSCWFALRFLKTGFIHLGGHAPALRTWMLLFLLVMLQMSTSLRPLIGTAPSLLPSPTEKRFFVGHWLQCLQK